MKSIFTPFLLLLFTFSVVVGQAQNNLQLSIEHLLGEETFEYNKEVMSTDEHPFLVTRLQYYISQISVFHDGGKQTKIEDTWILVNTDGEAETLVDLGEYDMNQIDKIIFHVGVEEEVNHDDPALWPQDHPLAPKNPSMHWGWVGGYRFVAMEGLCGPTVKEVFQMHSVGNTIYQMVQVPVDEQAQDGVIRVSLKADYIRTLDGIDASKGFIQHGDLNEASQLMSNFGDFVFTDANGIVSTSGIEFTLDFDVFPNPASDGFVSVSMLDNDITGMTYQLIDNSGRILDSRAIQHSTFRVNLPSQSQTYFLQLLDDNQQIVGVKSIQAN